MLALSFAVLSAGCGLGTDRIRDIQARPGDYADTNVVITGEVVDALKMPLLGQFYCVADATGTIIVRTNREPLALGTEVVVHGNVQAVATIGGQSFGVHVNETARRTRTSVFRSRSFSDGRDSHNCIG